MQLQFDPRTEQHWLGFYDRARSAAWWKGLLCGLCVGAGLAVGLARIDCAARSPEPPHPAGYIGEPYSHAANDPPDRTPPADAK